MNQVLALEQTSEETLPDAVRELIAQRDAARAAKDWAASDRLRGEIELHGWQIKDTRHGQKVSRR